MNLLIFQVSQLDHFTKKFRGAAHTTCNLNNCYKKNPSIISWNEKSRFTFNHQSIEKRNF